MQEMKRKERATTTEDALALLESCEYMVLCMTDTKGNPYAVPLSPVLENSVVYFHCALEGKKLDCIRSNPNVCLVCADHITRIPQQFTTAFQSAMAYGRAYLIEDEAEKVHALRLICEKYAPSNLMNFDHVLQKSFARTNIVKIDITEISGKHKKQQYKTTVTK